jgi:hypothetical protein
MGKMAGAGIFDKLEPEPKFLTSWSRSRTKIDRLRNTGKISKNQFLFLFYRPLTRKPNIGPDYCYPVFLLAGYPSQ